jgi:hypothetical protein
MVGNGQDNSNKDRDHPQLSGRGENEIGMISTGNWSLIIICKLKSNF